MMDHFSRRVGALVIVGMLAALPAMADVPSADLSNVPNCVAVAPGGGLTYSVTIIGATATPIASANVEMRWTVAGDTIVCWCDPRPTPQPPSFYATTNASGIASFSIANNNEISAGGCIEYGLAAIPGVLNFAGEIFANGFKMREFGTVSPDAVDTSGRLPTDSSPRWNPNGQCATGLADAVTHTTPLATSVYNWCTDVNCDLATGLADGVILTPFLANAVSCAGNAGP